VQLIPPQREIRPATDLYGSDKDNVRAKRMKTCRTQLERLLDPDNPNALLELCCDGGYVENTAAARPDPLSAAVALRFNVFRRSPN
jgi:hypothetical protein